MIWRHICSNQIHFVLTRQRHNFAESSAIENTNQSVVHWYFNKPLPKPSILHNTLCGVCNNATGTYGFCCSCFLHRAEPKCRWTCKMSIIKCKRRKNKKIYVESKKHCHGYQTIQNQMIEWQGQLANWRKKTKKG